MSYQSKIRSEVARPVRMPAQAPAPAVAPPISAAEAYIENDFFRRCGFYATLALVFIKISTIHEIIQLQTGRSLYLLYIFTPPALLAMLFANGIRRTLRQRAAWYWVGFLACLVVSIPFSWWMGGSAKLLFAYCRDHLSMLFLVAGTVVTWKECKSVLHCATAATFFSILYSLRYGTSGGRLYLDFGGTIANANDLAAHLIFLIPIMLFIVLRPKTTMIVRIVVWLFIGLGMYTIVRTGSRGGLVATGIGGLVFLLRATPRQRIVASVLIPTALMSLLLVIPRQTFDRLMSFSTEVSQRGQEEAAESAEARKYLFLKSIEFTLRHPLFGVGMGQFSNYEGETTRAAGGQGNWHETHNSYTEVSSECGIPALLFYLAAIFSTFGILKTILKRARQVQHAEITVAMNCLLVCMTAFCFVIFFLPFAYRFYLPMMTGLSIAMFYATDREFRMRQASLGRR